MATSPAAVPNDRGDDDRDAGASGARMRVRACSPTEVTRTVGRVGLEFAEFGCRSGSGHRLGLGCGQGDQGSGVCVWFATMLASWAGGAG